MYYSQVNFNYLRKIPLYLKSTPMQPLLEELYFANPDELDLLKVLIEKYFKY